MATTSAVMSTPPMNDQFNDSSNATMDGNSLLKPRMPMWLTVICVLCAVIICVTAICGNALVLAAFIKFRSKVLSVFTVFALFLAFTDLAVGLVTLPLYIWYDLYYHLTNSTAVEVLFLKNEDLCFLETYFDFTPLLLSETTLFLMGIERCIAVFAPSKHAHIRPRHAAVVCGLVWTVLILLFTIDMIVNRDSILKTISSDCDHFSQDLQTGSVYFGAAVFLLCWAIYGVIFVKLCCNRKNANIHDSGKATKMTIIILIAFTIAYFPVILGSLVIYRNLPPVESTSLQNFLIIFLYANSAVNPFIYNKASDKFRIAFRKLLCLNTSTTKIDETVMSKTENIEENVEMSMKL